MSSSNLPVSQTSHEDKKNSQAKLAWQEAQRRHPILSKMPLWMWTALGLSPVAVITFVISGLGLLPTFTLLFAFVVILQLAIIRYAGFAHRRFRDEQKSSADNEIAILASRLKLLEEDRRPKFRALFLDLAIKAYPLLGDAPLASRKREGSIIEARVRILNEAQVETRIQNLSLKVELNGRHFHAAHAEVSERRGSFSLDGAMYVQPEPPDCLEAVLGKVVVVRGVPLEGTVRFKVAGLLAESEIPDRVWPLDFVLGIEDDWSTLHEVEVESGNAPRQGLRLKDGMFKVKA